MFLATIVYAHLFSKHALRVCTVQFSLAQCVLAEQVYHYIQDHAENPITEVFQPSKSINVTLGLNEFFQHSAIVSCITFHI